jgi:hypothetical protein
VSRAGWDWGRPPAPKPLHLPCILLPFSVDIGLGDLASRAGWDRGRSPAPERTSSRSRVSAFPVRVVGEPKTLGIIALLPIEALKGWIHLVALSFIAGMFPSHVRCGMTKLLVLLPQANPNGPGKAQQLDDFCSSCSWLFAVNSTSRRKRA